MTTLHLGVFDQPYSNSSEGQTTGSVARILEAKYHIMGTFFETQQESIAKALAESYSDAIDVMLSGNPPDNFDPAGAAVSDIKREFDVFIATGQMDGRVAGVPTQAAKDRAMGKKRSTRMAKRRKPKAGSKNKPVSFYDTGLYMDNFTAWVDNE